MQLDSDQTDTAAFGEGFNLSDEGDTGQPATNTVVTDAAPTDGSNTEPAANADDVDYRKLYEEQRAAREAAEARYSSLQGKFNAEVPRLTRQVKELQQRGHAAPQPSTDDTATDADTGDDADDDLPPEAAELLRDMPTVSKAVDALVRHRTRKIVQAQIQPLVERDQKSAADEHFAAIGRAHKDWNAVVNADTFKTWVDKLPSYRQGAAKQVLAEGDATSVIDLLSDFKKESGYQAPQGSVGGDDDDVAVIGRRSGGPKPGASAGAGSDDFSAGFNMPD